ncbi:MAG TPA: enolase C-terminal domain-like protein, partial [Acidimicrobiia bacterium]|nr:enolase C-terminal domain-like protein [Acidimicrobiia bacterium]
MSVAGLAGVGVRAHRVRIPLHVPLGRETTREATLVEGPAGWGEFSPLPGYPCDPGACEDAVREAVLVGWPAPVRRSIPVNGLVPAVGPGEAARLAADAAGAGMTTVKVKVGAGSLDGDADRVAAVRAALGPAGRIRLDANGAWDVDTARTAIGRLAAFDLELVEQPVADLEDLARLRRQVPVPLAADESLRSLGDARRLRALDAADAVVVKVQPLGGVRAALRIVEAAGVPAIVSSLYETSVGLAAGVALAAALPDLPFACGLGTASFLAGDVVADPLIPERGMLPVRRP